MEAFRKHWEIRPYTHNPADKKIAEYWWKAALRWVLEQRTHDLNAEAMDRFNEYYHISDCGLHIIEEELKQ